MPVFGPLGVDGGLVDDAGGLSHDAYLIEWRLEFAALDVFVRHPYRREDGLVDEAPLDRCGAQVEVVDVMAEDCQHQLERLLDLVVTGNISRALPLAAIVYGHDVRIVSDHAELVVRGRAAQKGAGFDAPRPGELAGCGVLRYGELAIDTASRVVTYGPMSVELRRREYVPARPR